MYATDRGSCWPRRVIAIRQSALFARQISDRVFKQLRLDAANK